MHTHLVRPIIDALRPGATAHRLQITTAAVDQRPQLGPQRRRHQVKQEHLRPTTGKLQEGLELSLEMNDVVVVVHHQRRRRKTLGQHLHGACPHPVGLRGGSPAPVRQRRLHAVQRLGHRYRVGRQPLLAPVQACPAVQGHKKILVGLGTLRPPQEQPALWVQRVVHHLEHPPLRRRVQVDQQVAAADQVQPCKGGILQQVLACKHHAVADALEHMAVGSHLLGVAIAQRLGDTIEFDRRVHGAARLLQGIFVQVRGENHVLQVAARVKAQRLFQQHGDAVGLFTGGASGHPATDHAVIGPGAHQFVDRTFQGVKGFGVTEEGGDADEGVAHQPLRLVLFLAKELDVLPQRSDPQQTHAPRDAPFHRGRLVVTQTEGGELTHQLSDLGVFIGLDRLTFAVPRHTRQFRQLQHQALEHATHVRGLEDQIHLPGLHRRTGHAVVFGGVRVLGDRESSGRLDGPQPGGTVGAGAGQDDAHRQLTLVLRQRMEKMIDRRLRPDRVHRLGQPQPALAHHDIPIGRCDVDRVRLGTLPVGQILHRQLSGRRQQVHQQAHMGGRDVLGNHIGQLLRLRQCLQQFAQCLQSPRRGANAHHPHGCSGLCSGRAR